MRIPLEPDSIFLSANQVSTPNLIPGVIWSTMFTQSQKTKEQKEWRLMKSTYIMLMSSLGMMSPLCAVSARKWLWYSQLCKELSSSISYPDSVVKKRRSPLSVANQIKCSARNKEHRSHYHQHKGESLPIFHGSRTQLRFNDLIAKCPVQRDQRTHNGDLI